MQSIRKKSFAAEQLAKRQKKNPVTIAIIVVLVVIAVAAVGYALYVRFGAYFTIFRHPISQSSGTPIQFYPAPDFTIFRHLIPELSGTF